MSQFKFITYSTEGSSHCYKTKIKAIQIRKKKKYNLHLLTDDIIIDAENLTEFTEKMRELVREFSKISVYNINVQKPIVFLHTSNGNKILKF